MIADAKPLCGDFRYASVTSKDTLAPDLNYAFQPDEIQVGSIVFAHFKRVIPDYKKKCDDARPMLVTGLWRDGEDIKKIEMMAFTSRATQHEDPSCFELDTSHFKDGQGERISYLRTRKVYLFDNDEYLFPRESNPYEMRMDGALWEDILVRRAHSIMFNTEADFFGDVDYRLKREGISFATIPHTAVCAHTFIPEVHFPKSLTRVSDAVPQEGVDYAASFAAKYDDKMNRAHAHGRYSFPAFAEWPLDLPEKRFPKWRNAENDLLVFETHLA